jgi:hypothetical protein
MAVIAKNKVTNKIVMTKTLKPVGQSQFSIIALTLVSSIVASILTVALLLAWILPSAYGLDPMGWGAKLGIAPHQAQAEANTAPIGTQPLQAAAQVASQAALATATQADDPLAVREDTVQLIIPAQQSLDYRLAMERDYELDYQWTANDKTVYTELRGETKDGKIPGKIFAKLTSTSGKGFFIIPFNGQFGWHWQNKTNLPITIRLHTKGTYQVIGQVGAAAPT